MIRYLLLPFTHYKIRSLLLYAIACFSILALASYNQFDPSFNVASESMPTNWAGKYGSYWADLLLQLFGLSVIIPTIFCFGFASRMFFDLENGNWLLKTVTTLILTAIISVWFMMSGIRGLNFYPGGALGKWLVELIDSHDYRTEFLLISIPLFGLLSVYLTNFDIKLLANIKLPTLWSFNIQLPTFSFKKQANQTPYQFKARIEPSLKDYSEELTEELAEKHFSSPDQFRSETADTTVASAKSGLHSFLSPVKPKTTNNKSTLPPMVLLSTAHSSNIKLESKTILAENAGRLSDVLADFGIKGKIVDVQQGPVVTTYELEPAAGTKSSRVIGLSDDIARSLSAVSTRIATVPGRNILGIELPNKERAFFGLRELLETSEYKNPDIILPIVLGKNIVGQSTIVDLAKMPHLLVAGTTGSGKSVAINVMILSLLYRFTPQECKFIMIDPKMLELSVYDNIPHLLTPVVTEPSKAIIALKWAVKEMENRYRLMTNLNVRNISGYNSKIAEALQNGQTLTRRVQTGFDPETGHPIYETIALDMERLPYIVIIVDEMADLMLVAGKDIESSIQRLAQMARAAGIHLIMATQRPSVDVITGVIKANFPSRISFKVTSKIDSRTILGEQGAEQLLGMGDMLYMGTNSKINRIHCPFVNDSEVEKIADFLRASATPEYITSVTQSDEEQDEDWGGIESSDDDALYRQAVQIVKTERKASISYIQRSLRIGYNRAAIIVERMEKEGVLSAPNHTGKREILLPE